MDTIQRNRLVDTQGRERHPSPTDFILQPLFSLAALAMSFTLTRLLLVLAILPLYLLTQLLSSIPHILLHLPSLLTATGRQQLLHSANVYRAQEDKQERAQGDGSFRFGEEQLVRGERARGKIGTLAWKPRMEGFEVEGARVNVVCEVPAVWERRSGKKVLLVHGNPSWSFMWRDVIPSLLDAGHEVFALDWLGHGASDKPVSLTLISFELHMRTLRACIEHFNLQGCYILAHDWGGCIALCTIPHLPPNTTSGILLLNTFFPPRPTDISPHYYLLYLLWFFSTGILGGYMPESAVMRYMSPRATARIIEGYSAPYAGVGPQAKASVSRFSHIVPGFGEKLLLGVRNWSAWRIFEGLCGPERFSNVNEQARLLQRDMEVRKWWAESKGSSRSSEEKDQDGKVDGEEKVERPAVGIAFGADDPLLKEYKNVLQSVIAPKLLWRKVGARWISGAGHYPVEEQADEVVKLMRNLMDDEE